VKRARYAFALAVLLVAFHVLLRALGLSAHLSAIAGMPLDACSLPIAGLYVLAYLGAIVVAPILALASLAEAAALRLRPEA
jgi:hypothetical protein